MFWYIIHSILVALAVFFSGCLIGGILRRFKGLVFGVNKNEHCCGDPNITPAQQKAAAAAAAAGTVAVSVGENDGDVTIVESETASSEYEGQPVVYEAEEPEYVEASREDDVVVRRLEEEGDHTNYDHIEVEETTLDSDSNAGVIGAGVAGVAASAATYLADDEDEVSVEPEPVAEEPSVLPEIKRDNWTADRTDVGRVAVDQQNPHHYRYSAQSGEERISGERSIHHNVWDDGDVKTTGSQAVAVEMPTVSETPTQDTSSLATASAGVAAAVGVAGALYKDDTVLDEPEVQVDSVPAQELRKTISFAANGACQDLSLIRGLESDDEEELNDLGICRYDQLSGLSAEEVHYLKMKTGCGHRIHSQGWIEQAFLLAKEEDTLFSKKKR